VREATRGQPLEGGPFFEKGDGLKRGFWCGAAHAGRCCRRKPLAVKSPPVERKKRRPSSLSKLVRGGEGVVLGRGGQKKEERTKGESRRKKKSR